MKKIVLVTGGSRGIGYKCVEKFLFNGWEVVTTSRNPPPISNSKIHFYRADFYNDRDISSMANKVNEDFESLNAVVHCVGDVLQEAPIRQLNSDILQKVFQINFFSAIMISRHFFDRIAKTKGSFVFITSVAKDKVYPNIPIYCTAKASLSNFIKSLALELAPYGARAVGVSPAVVDTNLFKKSEYTVEEASKWHKLGRIGKPEEIASLIYYLASEDSKWITGVEYTIDGGMLL